VIRLYRVLLWLYPASFRHEYGTEMTALFRYQLREAGSPWGRAGVWMAALAEALVGAFAVHADILRRDLRQTVRQARRAPGVVTTAVLIIALGTGAATAVFAVADFVLFRPLPFPDSERLVRLWERRPGYGQMELSPANFRDWRDRTRSVERMAALTRVAANLTGGGEPVRVEGARVTGGLFRVLGTPPALGRALDAADARPGAASVVVLSHGLWLSRFGGDRAVVGRSVRLDDQPHEIIGVMPPDFVYPHRDVRFWAALPFAEDDYLDRNNNYLQGVARLRADATVEAVRGELDRVTSALEAEYPIENENARATVIAMRDALSTRARVLLSALSAAALCILLIACVNLANLMIARALARRQELVVRAALGAGRERLARQLATEVLCLTAVGGTLGIAIGGMVVPLLVRLVPEALPLTGQPGLDGRVLAVSVATMLLIGLGAGLPPLARVGGADLSSLREAGRGGAAGGERLRGALVAVGLACSVVLLVVAGLLMRTLWTLQSRDPGFQAAGVLTLRTALPMPAFEATEPRTRWLRDATSAVLAVPGVTGAAYTSFAPMAMGGGIWPVVLDTGDLRREDGRVASLRFVTPGFFETLGIPVHQGRDVRWSDTATQPPVALVSESFTARYWPGEPAIGQRFEIAFFEREVVGVVGDIRNRGLELESEPQVYLPAGQVPDGGLSFYTPKDLVIRTSVPFESVRPGIRSALRQFAPDQPVSDVRPLAAVVADHTAARAVQLRVIETFAAVALLLAGLGIHGLLAFVVSARTREIGVRMALGASRGAVLAMVLRRTGVLLAASLGPGLALAAVAGTALRGVLVGVRPADPLVFAAATALCVAAAVLGSTIPAKRAARVEPAVALRGE
jgi:predicted permease